MPDPTRITIRVIDLAALPGYPGVDHRGQQTPDHDYRLDADTPTGGSICFHRGATADDVAAYWAREGWTS